MPESDSGPELTPEQTKRVVSAYIRTLISADMMQSQTGYPMTDVLRLAVGAFRRFNRDEQEVVLRALDDRIDVAIEATFVDLVMSRLNAK